MRFDLHTKRRKYHAISKRKSRYVRLSGLSVSINFDREIRVPSYSFIRRSLAYVTVTIIEHDRE